MNKMRRGFTMIELIFVVVVIGILASVAIPKLAVNRDEAQANACVHEYKQLMREYASAYTAAGGFDNWKTVTFKDITNITLGTREQGIKQTGDVLVHRDASGGQPATYYCAGEWAGSMRARISADGLTYELYAYIKETPSSPTGIMFRDKMLKQFGSTGKKTIKL